LGQLKSTLYARMEEVSFRSGAVVAGGMLTAAGVAITLAVVLGGHSDAVASAPASRAAVPSAVPPVLAPVSSSPPATPSPATPPPATPSPATPSPRHLVPRAPRPAVWSGWRHWHRSPAWRWPWGLSRHHRRR
jgi:hypothetical protein